MPSRLIRDDMLDSERVQTLPIEARWLYVSVLLTADDVGLFECNAFRLGRRAGIDQSRIGLLVQLLADADLVRIYEVDGKRFGFVPRYRQKLTIKRTRHPQPPVALTADDADATAKLTAFNAGGIVGAFGQDWERLRQECLKRDDYACIRCQATENLTAHHLTPKSKGGEHVLSNLTTLCQSCNSWARNNDEKCRQIKDLVVRLDTGKYQDSINTVPFRRPEPEPEPEEEIREPTVLVVKAAPYRPAPCPNEEIVGLYHQHLAELPSVAVLNDARKRAISARWREVCAESQMTKAQGLDWFAWFFNHVAKSQFLLGKVPGKSGRTWHADFDFLMAPTKFARVIEGSYHKELA